MSLSLGTLRRLFLASALATTAFAATGCGDDKAPTNKPDDGGDGDGDVGDGDVGDGDVGDGDGDTMGGTLLAECNLTCSGKKVATLELTPCCAGTAEAPVCGLNVDALPGLTGCLEANALPQAPKSESCAAFFDQVDGDDPGDGMYSIYAEDYKLWLSFPSCCAPSGECGVVFNAPKQLASADLGLGCVTLSTLMASLEPGGPVLDTSNLTSYPYCDPGKAGAPAACPPSMGEAGCAGLVAAGFACDPTGPTPEWICAQLGLPIIGQDAPPVLTPGEDCMKGVPVFVQGCGTQSAATCVPGIPAGVFGCEAVTAVPTVPEYVCGCGTGQSGESCIPNVPQNICGAVPVTEGSVPGLPEYACGCGDGVLGEGKCLPNIPMTVCGDQPVTEGTVPNAPDYICGCGDGVVYTPTTKVFPCLSNVPDTVCGGTEVTADKVPGIPEYVCGCGTDKTFSGVGAPCLAHKDVDVCGAVDTVPGKRGDVDCLVGVPEYAKGCGEADFNGTCLRGAEAFYGCSDVTTSPVNLFEYLCGCGEEATYGGTGLPCLSFVATTICGAIPFTGSKVPNLPNIACGCGEAIMGNNCIDNVPTNVCGANKACDTVGGVGAEAGCGAGLTCADTNEDTIGDLCVDTST